MKIDKAAIKQTYFTFDGKLTNAEYLRAFLILLGSSIVIGFALGILGAILGAIHLGFIVAILWIPVSIGLTVASFAIAIKRFHDLGLSGWCSLLLILPVIGLLTIIYLCIAKSKPTLPTV